jgi:hypothetical protein
MGTATKSGFGRAKLRGARDHAAPVTARVKGQSHAPAPAQAFRIAGVVVASINPAYQASLRKSLPALAHRVIHRI